ncbi:protein INCA1 isoform X3 [Panthera pardus]|nr:protein INCA1 isoform X3 [Panthera pardus]XP_053749251.1 protein INCA1 isoform X3 [Panthera pardus]
MQQGPAGIPAQVRAVTYHLEDLRRRQRIINELKKAQWDVSGAAPEPLAPATAGCGVPSATEYPGLEEARATYPQEEGHPVTTGRTQLLWSPWSPLGLGGSGVPRRLGSLASYSAVPAGRNRLRSPGAWRCSLRSKKEPPGPSLSQRPPRARHWALTAPLAARVKPPPRAPHGLSPPPPAPNRPPALAATVFFALLGY